MLELSRKTHPKKTIMPNQWKWCEYYDSFCPIKDVSCVADYELLTKFVVVSDYFRMKPMKYVIVTKFGKAIEKYMNDAPENEKQKVAERISYEILKIQNVIPKENEQNPPCSVEGK
jgi:hypothetical protein